jgi:hypothetical protein
MAFLDFPHEPASTDEAAPANLATERDAEDMPPVEVEAEAPLDDSAESGDDALPPLMGTLLYPANLDGLVQIGIFVAGLFIIDLIGRLLSRIAGPVADLWALLLCVMLGAYVVFYLGYCIFDSSQGGRSAPPISTAHTPDRWDIVAQVLVLLGCVAICFWPAALYHGLTGRLDLPYWALAALGAFPLPMALLTGTLFEGIAALNPLPIVRAIAATLPAYLVLLVKLVPLGVVLAVVYRVSGRYFMARPLRNVACLYLLLIGCHLLGRFYWNQKDRLQWGL